MYNKTIEKGKLKMENEKKSGARSIKDEKIKPLPPPTPPYTGGEARRKDSRRRIVTSPPPV